MNELKTAIAETFVIWQLFWKPPVATSPEMVDAWAVKMADSGVSAEQFRKAAAKVADECKYWPTPKDVVDAVKATLVLPAHQLFKELPMPEGDPITPEQKREILAGMKNPEAAKLLLRVIHGGEDERQEEA